ncbi:Fc.00g013350.m01.CDS01 [Cosmosporella sp. VM-42]
MADSGDEPITLSDHALAALAEFQAEKDARIEKFEKLKAYAQAKDDKPLSMAAFVEDWNESQFWVDQLLDGATANTTIGVLSTPSVFVALKNRLKQRSNDEDLPKLVLFEHDDRFNVFPEFVYYDYQQPLKLPVELKGSLSRLIVDPPFFNNDCQTKCQF